MNIHQYKSIEHFVSKQKELLKLEQNEEICERQQMYENQSIKDLIKKGVCVNRLQLDHQSTGLYGKHVLVFTLNHSTVKNDHLNSHRLTSGDIVGLYPNKGSNSEVFGSGIVAHTRPNSISVAFNEMIELPTSSLFRLMKLTNDVTYRRLNRAIDAISKSKSEQSPFLDLLFPCQFIDNQHLQNTSSNIKDFFNDGLDSSQKEAVEFVVNSNLPMTVIHGPPGTGKTTTVIEIVLQETQKFYKKILVCAPSNIAVDNLVERLVKANVKVVRLGHPARAIEDVQKHSLDALLDSQDSSNIIKDVKAEITALCNSKKEKGKQKWIEVKKLRKELVTRQEKAITGVLMNADVVLSTTTSASLEGPLKHLPKDHFDLLIIDEAAQAMEISCWIPLLQVKRCILAGDHFQLPPTIISKKAAKDGLETTMLERVVHGLGENAVKMLTVQYRMNTLIMQWPSQELYHNKLLAADMVAHHRLCDLDNVRESENTTNPFIFVDTSGCNMYELEEQDEESKGNEHEVEIVYKQIEDLISDGLTMNQIGVITPYNLQVEMLRQRVLSKFPHVEIKSVDGFQGREKEAILISLVRSNENGEIGFLREDRRINVAITRARRHLFIVGDSVTISKHPFLDSLCNFMFEQAIVRSPLYEENACPNTQSNVNVDLLEFELKDGNKPRINRQDLSNSKKAAGISSVEPKQTILKDNSHEKQRQKRVEKVIDPNHSECPNEDKDTVLEEKMNKFTNSAQKTLEFSPRLSAKQRAFVHEKAEALCLNHFSQGEGAQRRIIVTKKEQVKKSEKGSANLDSEDEAKINGIEAESLSTVCSTCQASVPKDNYQLHSLRCSRVAALQKQSKEASGGSGGSSKANEGSVKKKKPTAVKKKGSNTRKENEDVDALLDEFVKSNSRCSFPHCKVSIKLLGQHCEFCGQTFCLTHHMAEVHGCGHQAKVKARQDISKFGDSKPRAMNAVKKVHVQRKLDKKLDELQEERKRKPNKKK